MKTIKITNEQAELLNAGDDIADPIRRELKAQAQEIADRENCMVEIEHPEGYTFDAVEPR